MSAPHNTNRNPGGGYVHRDQGYSQNPNQQGGYHNNQGYNQQGGHQSQNRSQGYSNNPHGSHNAGYGGSQKHGQGYNQQQSRNNGGGNSMPPNEGSSNHNSISTESLAGTSSSIPVGAPTTATTNFPSAFQSMNSSSIVERAVRAEFTRPNATNVLISRSNVLSIYTVRVDVVDAALSTALNGVSTTSSSKSAFSSSAPAHSMLGSHALILTLEVPVMGHIEAMATVRFPNRDTDSLLLCFADAKLCVLHFDRKTNTVATVFIHQTTPEMIQARLEAIELAKNPLVAGETLLALSGDTTTAANAATIAAAAAASAIGTGPIAGITHHNIYTPLLAVDDLNRCVAMCAFENQIIVYPVDIPQVDSSSTNQLITQPQSQAQTKASAAAAVSAAATAALFSPYDLAERAMERWGSSQDSLPATPVNPLGITAVPSQLIGADFQSQTPLTTGSMARLSGRARAPFNAPFSFALSSLGLPVPALEVLDMAFLGAFSEPTLLLLVKSRETWVGRYAIVRDVYTLVAISLSLSDHKHSVVSVQTSLPADSFKIVPLPAPFDGAIVLSANTIFTYSTSGLGPALGLNEFGSDRAPYRDFSLRLPIEPISAISPDSEEAKETEMDAATAEKGFGICLGNSRCVLGAVRSIDKPFLSFPSPASDTSGAAKGKNTVKGSKAPAIKRTKRGSSTFDSKLTSFDTLTNDNSPRIKANTAREIVMRAVQRRRALPASSLLYDYAMGLSSEVMSRRVLDFFITSSTGSLYVLRVTTRALQITGLSLQKSVETPVVPTALTVVSPSLLFVGSMGADSQLLEFHADQPLAAMNALAKKRKAGDIPSLAAPLEGAFTSHEVEAADTAAKAKSAVTQALTTAKTEALEDSALTPSSITTTSTASTGSSLSAPLVVESGEGTGTSIPTTAEADAGGLEWGFGAEMAVPTAENADITAEKRRKQLLANQHKKASLLQSTDKGEESNESEVNTGDEITSVDTDMTGKSEVSQAESNADSKNGENEEDDEDKDGSKNDKQSGEEEDELSMLLGGDDDEERDKDIDIDTMTDGLDSSLSTKSRGKSRSKEKTDMNGGEDGDLLDSLLGGDSDDESVITDSSKTKTIISHKTSEGTIEPGEDEMEVDTDIDDIALDARHVYETSSFLSLVFETRVESEKGITTSTSSSSIVPADTLSILTTQTCPHLSVVRAYAESSLLEVSQEYLLSAAGIVIPSISPDTISMSSETVTPSATLTSQLTESMESSESQEAFWTSSILSGQINYSFVIADTLVCLGPISDAALTISSSSSKSSVEMNDETLVADKPADNAEPLSGSLAVVGTGGHGRSSVLSISSEGVIPTLLSVTSTVMPSSHVSIESETTTSGTTSSPDLSNVLGMFVLRQADPLKSSLAAAHLTQFTTPRSASSSPSVHAEKLRTSYEGTSYILSSLSAVKKELAKVLRLTQHSSKTRTFPSSALPTTSSTHKSLGPLSVLGPIFAAVGNGTLEMAALEKLQLTYVSYESALIAFERNTSLVSSALANVSNGSESADASVNASTHATASVGQRTLVLATTATHSRLFEVDDVPFASVQRALRESRRRGASPGKNAIDATAALALTGSGHLREVDSGISSTITSGSTAPRFSFRTTVPTLCAGNVLGAFCAQVQVFPEGFLLVEGGCNVMIEYSLPSLERVIWAEIADPFVVLWLNDGGVRLVTFNVDPLTPGWFTITDLTDMVTMYNRNPAGMIPTSNAILSTTELSRITTGSVNSATSAAMDGLVDYTTGSSELDEMVAVSPTALRTGSVSISDLIRVYTQVQLGVTPASERGEDSTSLETAEIKADITVPTVERVPAFPITAMTVSQIAVDHLFPHLAALLQFLADYENRRDILVNTLTSNATEKRRLESQGESEVESKTEKSKHSIVSNTVKESAKTIVHTIDEGMDDLDDLLQSDSEDEKEKEKENDKIDVLLPNSSFSFTNGSNGSSTTPSLSSTSAPDAGLRAVMDAFSALSKQDLSELSFVLSSETSSPTLNQTSRFQHLSSLTSATRRFALARCVESLSRLPPLPVLTVARTDGLDMYALPSGALIFSTSGLLGSNLPLLQNELSLPLSCGPQFFPFLSPSAAAHARLTGPSARSRASGMRPSSLTAFPVEIALQALEQETSDTLSSQKSSPLRLVALLSSGDVSIYSLVERFSPGFLPRYLACFSALPAALDRELVSSLQASAMLTSRSALPVPTAVTSGTLSMFDITLACIPGGVLPLALRLERHDLILRPSFAEIDALKKLLGDLREKLIRALSAQQKRAAAQRAAGNVVDTKDSEYLLKLKRRYLQAVGASSIPGGLAGITLQLLNTLHSDPINLAMTLTTPSFTLAENAALAAVEEGIVTSSTIGAAMEDASIISTANTNTNGGSNIASISTSIKSGRGNESTDTITTNVTNVSSASLDVAESVRLSLERMQRDLALSFVSGGLVSGTAATAALYPSYVSPLPHVTPSALHRPSLRRLVFLPHTDGASHSGLLVLGSRVTLLSSSRGTLRIHHCAPAQPPALLSSFTPEDAQSLMKIAPLAHLSSPREIYQAVRQVYTYSQQQQNPGVVGGSGMGEAVLAGVWLPLPASRTSTFLLANTNQKICTLSLPPSIPTGIVHAAPRLYQAAATPAAMYFMHRSFESRNEMLRNEQLLPLQQKRQELIASASVEQEATRVTLASEWYTKNTILSSSSSHSPSSHIIRPVKSSLYSVLSPSLDAYTSIMTTMYCQDKTVDQSRFIERPTFETGDGNLPDATVATSDINDMERNKDMSEKNESSLLSSSFASEFLAQLTMLAECGYLSQALLRFVTALADSIAYFSSAGPISPSTIYNKTSPRHVFYTSHQALVNYERAQFFYKIASHLASTLATLRYPTTATTVLATRSRTLSSLDPLGISLVSLTYEGNSMSKSISTSSSPGVNVCDMALFALRLLLISALTSISSSSAMLCLSAASTRYAVRSSKPLSTSTRPGAFSTPMGSGWYFAPSPTPATDTFTCYDMSKTTTRLVHVRSQVVSLVYHAQSHTIAALVARRVYRTKAATSKAVRQGTLNIPLPIYDEHAEILFYDAHTFQTISRFDGLEQGEIVLAFCTVLLDGKELICLGTGRSEGQLSPASGRIVVLEPSFSMGVNNDGERTRFLKLQQAENKEKGPVNAICRVGDMVCLSHGSRVMLYSLKREFDGSVSFVGKAFFDADFFPVALRAVRNVILVADAVKSVSLLVWDPVLRTLQLLAKDLDEQRVLAADFMVNEGLLAVGSTDDIGNFEILRCAPRRSLGVRSRVLEACADFHVGSRIFKLLTVSQPSKTLLHDIFLTKLAELLRASAPFQAVVDDVLSARVDPNQVMNLYEKSAVSSSIAGVNRELHPSRTIALGATQDGTLVVISPILRSVYLRLQSLVVQLANCMPHVGGLNPFEYRLYSGRITQHRGTPKRDIIDMDLANLFLSMQSEIQRKLAYNMGTSPAQLIEDILMVQTACAFYPLL